MHLLRTLLLIAILLIPLCLNAAQDYKFVGEFGGKGEGKAQFAKTLYMAFGLNGDTFVTDTENFKIHKFSNNGEFLFDIEMTEAAKYRFINPTAIAIGVDGLIYVMDWILQHIDGTNSPKIFNYGPCIHKFDVQGEYVVTFPLQDFSKRIDNLEAAAPGLDSDGKYALIIPQGDTTRDFLLAIDAEDNLYVYDDGSIHKLDVNGKPILKFEISQPGVGQVIHPADMTVDKSGNLYIVDEKGHRVVKFSPDGKFVLAFGEYGNADREFIAPFQITTLTDGTLLVADKARYLKDFLSTLPRRLDDPTHRLDGSTQTFRYRLHRVQRFTTAGKLTQKILMPFQRETETDTDLQLKGVDSSGNLYYLNPSLLTFRKYAPTTSLFSSMFQTELKLRYTRDIQDIEIDNQDDLDADLYTKSDFDEQIIQNSADAHLTFTYDLNENYRIGLSNQLTYVRMTDTSFYRAQDFEDFRGRFNQDDRTTESSWDNRIQLDFTWIRDHGIYNYREARIYAYLSTINLDFINDALDRSNFRLFDFYAKLSDWGGGVYYDLSRTFRLHLELTHFIGKNNYTYIDETGDLYATGFQQADTYRAVLYINGFF